MRAVFLWRMLNTNSMFVKFSIAIGSRIKFSNIEVQRKASGTRFNFLWNRYLICVNRDRGTVIL